MYLTEKESEITNHIYLDKMRRLYQKDKTKFSDILEYMPLPVTKSNVITWNFTELNALAEKMTGRDKDFILNEGSAYTTSLIQKENIPIIREYLKQRSFQLYHDRVIPYFQNARYQEQNEYTWLYTYKIFLNKEEYFSLYQPMHNFRVITPLLVKSLEKQPLSIETYSRFHSLTNREKEILKLISKGLTNKEIGESLFISMHTARTHRNHIWKKLDIKHVRDALRFASLFDLI